MANIKLTDELDIKTAQLLITNMSETTARRRINHLREYLKKQQHQLIFVSEFVQYYGVPFVSK